ncbi:MAG: PspC domain-containing protein [Bacillota bacterium]
MQKRLYRSRSERVIAGVCGGLAQYFAVDPTLVRIIWVLLALSGTGILLYLIALLVIPEEPRALAEQPRVLADEPRAAAEQAAGREERPADAPEAPSATGQAGPAPTNPAPTSEPASPESRMWAGLILVAVGLYFLGRNLFPHLFFLQGRYLWPLLLVLVGAVVLAGGLRRRG